MPNVEHYQVDQEVRVRLFGGETIVIPAHTIIQALITYGKGVAVSLEMINPPQLDRDLAENERILEHGGRVGIDSREWDSVKKTEIPRTAPEITW